MHTETGQVVDGGELEKMSPEHRSRYVPINRDLTKLEAARKQIQKYAPCGCGSGKKFKFCCYKKPTP